MVRSYECVQKILHERRAQEYARGRSVLGGRYDGSLV